jgi:hypothetical protein
MGNGGTLDVFWGLPNIPLFQRSNIPELFGPAGGTAVGCAAPAGGGCRTLKLPAAGKGKGRDQPSDLLTLALRTFDLFRGIEDQFLKIISALAAVIFVNRHFRNPLQRIIGMKANIPNSLFVKFVSIRQIRIYHNIFLICSARIWHLALARAFFSSLNSDAILLQASSAFLKCCFSNLTFGL